jgi:hypothetical protein
MHNAVWQENVCDVVKNGCDVGMVERVGRNGLVEVWGLRVGGQWVSRYWKEFFLPEPATQRGGREL